MFVSFSDPIMMEYIKNHIPPTDGDINYMCDILENKHLALVTANQIGIQYRMFVQQIDDINTVIYNPSFTAASDARICVIERSPQINADFAIDRYREIDAKWEDENGNLTTRYLTGMNAATFQSGVDYLNGIPPWAYSKRKI